MAERLDGAVVPIEVKFRKRIDAEDLSGIRLFQARYGGSVAMVVTRDLGRWDEKERTLFVPLQDFLLFF